MTRSARLIMFAAFAVGVPLLAGCSGSDKEGKSVQMKDLEVVDGTATDAMTDLDGVQSEGASIALPAGNASNASTPARAPETADKEPAEAEVLADQ